MAEPKKQPVRQLLSRRRVPMLTRPVELPDAINETLRVSGVPLRQLAAQAQVLAREQHLQMQARRRENYRRTKRFQAQLAGALFDPTAFMDDAAIDRAIALEDAAAKYRHPEAYIGPDPTAGLTPEARHAMGRYTAEEREQAARMNDMRSSTFFGNVMPNFGRQAAYNNPGAEMDAFRQTALYLPNAVVAGSSFGLPSATTAAASGLRSGWQAATATGANLGQKATTALTTAAKEVAPVVTNPRWAATTATVVTPMAAAANDGAEQSGGFWNWVGNHPMETFFMGALAYKGGKGLWRKGANRLRIPAEPTEGRPQVFTETPPERGAALRWTYNPADYPPRMETEPMLGDFRIEVVEPSSPRPAPFAEIEPPRPSGLRPKKKGKAAQWDALDLAHRDWEARRNQYEADNADLNRQWDEYEQALYGPAQYDLARYQAAHDDWSLNAQSRYLARVQQHQADVADYNAEQQSLDQQYNTDLWGYNQRRAVNEQAWNTYHESDPYKQWLERKNGVLNFRKRAWNGVKNNWYWAVPGAYMGYNWLTGGYSDKPEQSNLNDTNSEAALDSVPALPEGFRPILGINDSNLVVVPSQSGRPDSIVNLQPINRSRFGRGEN